MIKLYFLATFAFFFIAFNTFAQNPDVLRKKIQQIISTKKAVVGVSIIGNQPKDTVSFNGDRHYPMQSVFKLHIALTVLAEIDKRNFSFNQKINISKNDLIPDLYSPIRDKYPNGATLSISEILMYTVAESDNVGCEVLLRLLGGPQAVENYFFKNNFKDVNIRINEIQQQSNWDLQFKNWTTPKCANQVLNAFLVNPKLLSQKSYNFIWDVLKSTGTGKKRLKGKLPSGVIIAHKTGSSGQNKDGTTAAVNDIGVVFLPNGEHYFISVFVTESTENEETNEEIIADISKAAWNYFNGGKIVKNNL